MRSASRAKPCTKSTRTESEAAVPRRFTPEARSIVVAATNAAGLLQSEQTEAEHFLIAMLVGPRTPVRDYLIEHGLTRDDVERAISDTDTTDVSFDDDDVAALAALGFDLPDILERLEDRFGPMPPTQPKKRGPRKLHVGLGDSAKQMLSQALIEASFRNEEISAAHLLLGLLRAPSPTSADLMDACSITYEDASARLLPPPQRNAG